MLTINPTSLTAYMLLEDPPVAQALDAKSGRLLWRYYLPQKENGTEVAAITGCVTSTTFWLYQGYIYYYSGFRISMATKVIGLDLQKGTVICTSAVDNQDVNTHKSVCAGGNMISLLSDDSTSTSLRTASLIAFGN